MEKIDTSIAHIRKYNLLETNAPNNAFISTTITINRKHFDIYKHQLMEDDGWFLYYVDDNHIHAAHTTHHWTAKWVAERSN